MKKVLLLLMPFLLFSCREEIAEKPDRLLKEEKMADILYDLSLLQAMNAYSPKTLDENKVDPKGYIFRKYGIDSATFAQNQRYYISQLEKYEAIQKKVAQRLEAQRTELDSLLKKDANTAKPDNVKRSDSLSARKRAMLKRLKKPVKE